MNINKIFLRLFNLARLFYLGEFAEPSCFVCNGWAEGDLGVDEGLIIKF
jgi:hypothetical protein